MRLHFGAVGVFQPAVVVGYFLAEISIRHRALGRGGQALSWSGEAAQERQRKQQCFHAGAELKVKQLK